MNEDFVRKARIFIRAWLQYATTGVVNLSVEECLHFYLEAFIMADFLQDNDTIMLVCNQLALLFEKLELYSEALQYRKLHLTFAVEAENKPAQLEAYAGLGNTCILVNKHQDALLCYEKARSIAVEIGDKDNEVACSASLGHLYYALGNHGDAISSSKQCLKVALERNNKVYEKLSYVNMAGAYVAMKDYPLVVTCCEECLKISTEDDKEVNVNMYKILGDAYQELNKPQQAIESYKKTLEIAQQLQIRDMERIAYQCLGNCYFTQADFHMAIDYLEKEMKCAVRLDDKNNVSRVYSELGGVYVTLGNYGAAIYKSQKALEIAETIGDKSVQVSALKHLGIAYQNQGDYHKAIKYIERSLRIATDIGSKDGQARAYSSLGMAYQSLGNYYEAVKYQSKALEMSVEIKYKKGEQTAHGNLGVVFAKLGQYQEAIVHLKKNLEIARQISDKYVEGRAIANLGTCFFKIDKFEEAVNCFQEALELAILVKDKEGQVDAYGNLGSYNTAFGQYDKALEMLETKIRLAEEIGEKSQQASGYGAKGKVYVRLHEHRKAMDCFEKQLKIAKETDTKNEESFSYYNLGSLYAILAFENEKSGEQENQREQCIGKSIRYLRESLRCSEWLYDHLQEQDHFKISIVDTFIEQYKLLSIMLLHNSQDKEALLVLERGRARALDDLLVSKYNINQDNQSERDAISYAEIERMGSDCSILFYSLQSPVSYFTWIVNSLNSTAFIGKKEIGLFVAVNNAYNTMKVREVKCEDRSIQTDQQPLDNENVSTVTPQKSSSLDITERVLLPAYEQIKQRCIPDEDLYDDDNSSPLEGLYKTLIYPVLHLLTEDEIVIIPDGVLFTVPFAALQDPKTGKFLSETKLIRLAPSLSTLKTLQQSPADFHSRTGALIIGNPTVSKVMYRGRTRELSDLPCAEREAQMIGELLGVKPFITSGATKQIIKQNLREGVAVIHFAAHGTTTGEIFLTPSTACDLPSEEDYILTMKDVQESGVRPQLVVLSCCHSGRGEIKAEGVVGISRAFLAAGARAVVASLWAIADEATMVFMERFYTHLKDGQSASKSLQQAMRDMREIPSYSHPMFWAPFFLIGDDVTIKF